MLLLGSHRSTNQYPRVISLKFDQKSVKLAYYASVINYKVAPLNFFLLAAFNNPEEAPLIIA